MPDTGLTGELGVDRTAFSFGDSKGESLSCVFPIFRGYTPSWALGAFPSPQRQQQQAGTVHFRISHASFLDPSLADGGWEKFLLLRTQVIRLHPAG
jgi:hypothetical protein